jgi:hypothetical protein
MTDALFDLILKFAERFCETGGNKYWIVSESVRTARAFGDSSFAHAVGLMENGTRRIRYDDMGDKTGAAIDLI